MTPQQPAPRIVIEPFEVAEARRLAQLRVIGRQWRALQNRLNAVTTLMNAYHRR